MRSLRRFRAWCRAVDAARDTAYRRGEYRPPSPALSTFLAAVLFALGFASAFVFSDKSVTFAAGWFGACASFSIAIVLAGPGQYQKWLSSQWRKNGQCPHCGFDLRHSPQHCPECGSPVTDADRKHITASFTATEAGAVTESHFTKLWLSSTEPRHVLTLQRAANDSPEIFITFDLDPHSTPGQILSCSLTPDHLHLKLTGYFTNRYDHFHITLAIPPQQHEPLEDGLRKLLAGAGAKLSIH